MENVPLDLVYPIFAHLDRRELVNAALVSSTFNSVATPLLYRTLDSRISAEKVLFHPCTTLIQRPELAQYARKVTETGAVQLFRRVNPRIISDITAALRLCTNLESVEYTDDTDTPVLNFSPILQVLITLPLKELVIRTNHDVGEAAWALLNKIKGICRLSVWSLQGPPRVLRGWTDELTSTLTHLELGRCAGVPPTILISVFMKLPLLRELKLKGAPSSAIPAIIGCLPNLSTLDTEYLGSGYYRVPSTPLPALEQLTVRTSSVDILGPDRLWTWTRSLLPHVGSLKSFTFNSFSVYGRMAIPWPFIVFLATKQGQSLQEFIAGVALLNLDALSQLCLKCPALRTIHCTVASPDVESITQAISSGNSLRTLSLHVMWIEDSVAEPLASEFHVDFSGDSEESDQSENSPRYLDYSHPASEARNVVFTQEEAQSMMLRPGSKLRAVRLGEFAYTGQWVMTDVVPNGSDDATDGNLIFKVVKDTTSKSKRELVVVPPLTLWRHKLIPGPLYLVLFSGNEALINGTVCMVVMIVQTSIGLNRITSTAISKSGFGIEGVLPRNKEVSPLNKLSVAVHFKLSMSPPELGVFRFTTLVGSILVSLGSGTNYIYSAYAPQLGACLQLSHTQLNIIALAGNTGVYLSGPFWGRIVDYKGPRILLASASIFLLIGYLGIRRVYDECTIDGATVSTPRLAVLVVCSFMSGSGGCAGLSAALNATAKSFSSRSRATTTALVMSGFGLSAFFFTQLANTFFPGDVSTLLLTLAIGTGTPMLIGLLTIKPVPLPSTGLSARNVSRTNGYDPIPSEDGAIIREPRATSGHDVDREPDMNSTLLSHEQEPTSYQALVSPSTAGARPPASSHHERIVDDSDILPDIHGIRLWRDSDFHLIFTIMAICTGTGLMYINNVGSISHALYAKTYPVYDEIEASKWQAAQVSILSLGSFIARILIGLLCDFTYTRFHLPRAYCFCIVSSLFIISQAAAIAVSSVETLWVATLLVGLAYGSWWGSYASVIIEWFGLTHVSENLGYVSFSPVLGGNIFSLMFGYNLDTHKDAHSSLMMRRELPSEHECLDGKACYVGSLQVTLVACFVALGLSWWAGIRDGRKLRSRNYIGE